MRIFFPTVPFAHAPSPAAGYKLAADYCQNYDPKYGNSLNGPSSTKILEIVRWMFTHEALENERAPGGAATKTPPQGHK